MQRSIYAFCLLAAALWLTGCSPDHDDRARQGDHIWKSQTDTIDKAKSAVNQLDAAQAAQQRATDAARDQASSQ